MLSLILEPAKLLKLSRSTLSRGTVVTRFRSNGYEYKYSNVSRLSILNLLLNDNMSFGFWVYHNLVKVAVENLGYLRGNTIATGKLCYQMVGATYDSTRLCLARRYHGRCCNLHVLLP